MNNKKNLNMRCCCDTEITVPIPLETTMSGKDYVNLGQDNNFPQILFDTYTDCSILGSVINAVSDYVSGAGLDKSDKIINRKGQTLEELVQQVSLDYVLFGAFSVELIRNKLGELVEINFVDVRNVRLDESGDYVYYSKQWGKYNRNVKKYDRFKYNVNSPVSIMYYKNPKTRTIYGTPIWISALRSALTMIEASKLNYTSVLNAFVPNTIISFNNGIPSDDVQDEIEQMVLDKFTGSNGSHLMLNWADSKETAPEVSSFTTEDYTTRYTTVMDACRNDILSAFRCSGQLVGVLPEQTGFNSIEYKDAFSLFKETVIKPIQKEIEKAFEIIGVPIKLNEFEVEFANNNNNQQTTTI